MKKVHNHQEQLEAYYVTIRCFVSSHLLYDRCLLKLRTGKFQIRLTRTRESKIFENLKRALQLF